MCVLRDHYVNPGVGVVYIADLEDLHVVAGDIAS